MWQLPTILAILLSDWASLCQFLEDSGGNLGFTQWPGMLTNPCHPPPPVHSGTGV